MSRHDYKAALEVCDAWLAHIDRQKQNAETMQKAASLARKGKTEEARKLKSQVDNQPRVFDGANLLEVMSQIQSALRIADRLQDGKVSGDMHATGAEYVCDELENGRIAEVDGVFRAMSQQLLKECE